MGIDWICMVRVVSGCLALAQVSFGRRFRDDCTLTIGLIDVDVKRFKATASRLMRKKV